MHPILVRFSIGDTEVVLQAYSTFYVLAWVTAVIVATVLAWRRGISWWRALVTFVVALVVGIIGARLLNLAVNWSYYAEDLGRVLEIGYRGFSLYGGLLMALTTAMLLTKAFRLPLWRLADTTVPALAVGIVLMRTGCLLNGCCYGTATSLPWGVTYPTGSKVWFDIWAHQLIGGETGLPGLVGAVKPVHPTQVYEMIAASVFCGLAMWLLLRRDTLGTPRNPPGVPFLAFALGFTLFRLGNHFLRVQLPTASAPSWFYPLLYSLISVGLAGLIAWRIRCVGKAAPPGGVGKSVGRP